jgi:hypothetical protein
VSAQRGDRRHAGILIEKQIYFLCTFAILNKLPKFVTMKWINIKRAFLTSIESLVPESQQNFLKGFSELEQEMKSRFPEGLKNPALILDTANLILIVNV